MKRITLFTTLILVSASILYADVNDKLSLSSFKCSQTLHNKYMDICFDYNLKSAVAVDYTITKENLYKKKLDRSRVKFYADKRLPEKYRVSPYSYKKSGFDRGHLAPNGAFNYDAIAQKETFSMANMTPQYPKLNRYAWSKAERYSRVVAVKLGSVNVLDIVYFDSSPSKLKSGQAIPKGYAKIITNKKNDFQKCFYYKNIENPTLKLKDHIVNCDALNIK
jgi:endonuclease G